MQVTTKKERTICLLKSWLDAVKIPHAPSKLPGHDIAVQGRDGKFIDFEVSIDPNVQGCKPLRGGWKGAEQDLFEALRKAEAPLTIAQLMEAIGKNVNSVDPARPARNAIRRPIKRGLVVRGLHGFVAAAPAITPELLAMEWNERERTVIEKLIEAAVPVKIADLMGLCGWISSTTNKGPAKQFVSRLLGRGWILRHGYRPGDKAPLCPCVGTCGGTERKALYSLPLAIVKMDDLRSRDIDVAFTAFHAITERAGYGKPVPFDRGEEPEHKLHYSDNFELVSMRHRELRRSPNPNPEVLKKYKPVIEKAAWTFLRRNSRVCQRQCLEHADLVQYASIWTVNFLANYQVEDRGNANNEKMLCTHLLQRFGNFREVMDKKARSCYPDRDTAKIATQQDVEDWNKVSTGMGGLRSNRNMSWYQPADQEGVDQGYQERHNELGDTSTPEARRASAANLLERKLSEMPFAEMVSSLREVVLNRDGAFDPIACEEARRQLRLHLKDRVDAIVPDELEEVQSVLQEDEEVGGVDASGSED